MATEFISNSWLMPENSNQDKLANYSLSFNGTDQDISFASANSGPLNDIGTGDFTISVWGNATTKADYGTLIGNWSTNGLIMWRAATSNVFECYIGGDGFTTTYTIPFDDTWHHYLIKRSGTNVTVYVDGVSVATGTSSATLASSAISYIGNQPHNSRRWSGSITEVSIFDYALTDGTGGTTNQIGELYGTGSAVGNPMSLSTKPVAYYPLGQSAFNGEFLATNKATELFENYSLQLDGSDDFINCGNAFTQTGAFSVSAWIKTSTTSATSVLYKSGVFQFGKDTWYNGGVGGAPNLSLTDSGGITKLFRNGVAPSGATVTVGTVVDLKDGNWHHIAFTYNGTNQGKYYTDGAMTYTYDITDASWAGTLASNSNDLLIGKTTVANWNGNVSNISIYSSELTSAQVTTLYNSGKPFDLNTFAVTPVSWWRLGAVNSSFDGTNWTVLDEIGTNNGTSANMTQADLVDGVGATGNGVSSGMSSGTNRSDAPYSSNNAVSYNMSVTAKSTSVPT